MKISSAILTVLSATAMLACRGQILPIGEAADGGGVATPLEDGGSVLVEPDGGTLVIPAQTLVVKKVDLLFMIDNSASMGDKQAYLEAAIPTLVDRLIDPNCVSTADGTTVLGTSTLAADGTADCSAYPDSAPEFPAVHDMHIGIVSSSLGARLSDRFGGGQGGVCLPSATYTLPDPTTGAELTQSNHMDDQAHLLTRSSSPADLLEEVPLPDAQSSGFLSWFPNATANSGSSAGPDTTPITSDTQLETDFQDLLDGVHEYGCGIESQLESWYRFLIQPDPYASLALGSNGSGIAPAQWVGVDTTILKERHDFLRPDSLVAIVDLTDENDSEIDVRSFGGQGYAFMSTEFDPPHGSAACGAYPLSSSCTSLGSSDSSPYNSATDWGYDLNLRHVHMQQKYGLDPQFPIQRYQNGLASTKVPDRVGEYPAGAANYVGTNDCTNPLFAASLPDGTELSSAASTATTLSTSDAAVLCNLPAGPRTAGLVYYLHIGGVPWQLLHYSPTSSTDSELTSADWVRILGQDPLSDDYTGIDPHMVESYAPRIAGTNLEDGTPSLPAGTASLLPALTGPTGTSPAETMPTMVSGTETFADPYNGGERITNVGPHLDLNVDLQYACVFELTDPTTGAPTPRDCSKTSNGTYTVPANAQACDCSSTGLTADQLSPLCDPGNPTSQLYAKAYPTIRELTLAKLLGPQGLVASICPIDVADNATGTDPLFGYRPAVNHLIDRVRPALAYSGK